MVSVAALINHCRALSASEVGLNMPPHRASSSTRPLVSVGATNRDQWTRLTTFLSLQLFFVDSSSSFRFSPTSPSERHSQLFISPECRDDDKEAQCSCTLVSFKP